MRKAQLIGVLLLGFAVALAGCSPPHARYSAELREGLKLMNELMFAFKKIEQPDHAKTAGPEVRELATKLKDAKVKIDEAAPADEKLKEKILKKYYTDLSGIVYNLQSELKRASDQGLSVEAVAQVAEVLKSYEKLEVSDKVKK